MNKEILDIQNRNEVCDAVGCSARASKKIEVIAGPQKVISLLLCNNCVSRFQEVPNMLDTIDRPSECSDCARYIKEIAELKNAFMEADYKSVRQRIQYEDEILDDAKAAINRLKTEYNSRKPIQNAGVRRGLRDQFLTHRIVISGEYQK